MTVTTMPATCYLCGTAARMTHSPACRSCAQVTPAPVVGCVAPLRCYCPAHLGAPELRAAHTITPGASAVARQALADIRENR